MSDVSDLNDPLGTLCDWIHDGEVDVSVVELPWGRQITLSRRDSVDWSVSPKEHDMKQELLEWNDAVIEMIDSDREEWNEVLNEHGVADNELSEQLQVVADTAAEE